jgi:hypothetical protein
VPPTKAAEATFAHGRELMKDKKYPEACEAFEQSQRLDPQYGTQYNLAVCYELDGKLASAWNLYRLLARSDDKPARRAAAADQAEQLADRVPRISITFATKPAGATLAMNGADALALVGVETPVDLGAVKLVASAPGYQTWHHTVSVKEEKSIVEVAVHLYKVGDVAPADTLGDDATASAHSDGEQHSLVGIETRRRGAWKPKAGKIALIAGGGVTLVGLGLGVETLQQWRSAKGLDGPTGSTAAANAKVTTARHWGDASTVVVSVGLAGIAAGVILLVTAPHAEHPEHEAPHGVTFAPIATPDSAGVAVLGRF